MPDAVEPQLLEVPPLLGQNRIRIRLNDSKYRTSVLSSHHHLHSRYKRAFPDHILYRHPRRASVILPERHPPAWPRQPDHSASSNVVTNIHRSSPSPPMASRAAGGPT